MKILILHAHWSNRGDEAAIRAMIDSLRAQLPVEKMWIMIVGFKPEQFPYDDIEILKLYPIFFRKRHFLVDSIDAVFNILTCGRLSLTRRGRKCLRVVSEADVVIHAPGGPTIGDLNAVGDLSYLHRLLIANVFKGKPLFFYAPSMGPFSGRLRNVARKLILKRADAIILREEISAGYLRDQLGLEACVTLDSAFQNDIPEDYLEKYENLSDILELIEAKRTVGMVITDMKWYPKYRDSKGLAERIMASYSEAASYLIEKGYSVLLIPQLFGEGEDTRLLESIRALDNERIHICQPEIDSYGQQVLISRLFCVISMRYHPVVFAAKANIPFISIYYEHKAEGFARKVGCTDFTIHVENISAREIINTFEALEQNYDTVKEQLRAMNPLLKKEARKTTRIIVDKLAQLGWRID